VFKYILIGDASVGKSTILNHFINGDFKGDSNPTMGVEFATRKLHILDKVIKIQIWDTVKLVIFRQGRSLFGLLQGHTIEML
jgi:GTPase SAR1 family protein